MASWAEFYLIFKTEIKSDSVALSLQRAGLVRGAPRRRAARADRDAPRL
ncbi:MAG TPA: hypothetical protein VGP06_04315 [Janthinobacterium sp.]|jgi:hypothetical protein|nr:hypothetical protein [Janthinobacterium sp.]